MAYQTIIKKFAGALLLLVFSLSILPRNLLHDAVSGHVDNFYLVQQSDLPSLEEKGFQCEQFQMVVDIPFLVTAPTVFEYPLPLDNSIIKEEINSFPLKRVYHFSLRGPPAIPGFM